MADTPALSVIVPSVNGWDDLEGCLRHLRAQQLDAPLEVIVVDRLGDELRGRIRAAWPDVVTVACPGDTSIPQLRAEGFRRARGTAVAVIEDHVLVPPRWAARMLAALATSGGVVGGAVTNAATGRLSDWAAFLTEYSHCLAPAAGPSDWLTGNNVVYRRDLLGRHQAVWEAGRWENHLHDALRGDGIVLECHPDIEVGHLKHYSPAEYARERFLFSRAWAGARITGAPLARRLLYAAAAWALPPVLFLRVVRRVWASGRHRAELLRSLPLIAGFTVAWAAGDSVGYLLGPGDALARVR